jgi:hypothetical protein
MTNAQRRVKLKVERPELHTAKTLGLRLSRRELAALDALCKAGGDVGYAAMLRHLIAQAHAGMRGKP